MESRSKKQGSNVRRYIDPGDMELLQLISRHLSS